MDRSVEMRLRLEISNFMRNGATAGREMDALTARAALLDAQLDRVGNTAGTSATNLRDMRTQVRGTGRDAERAAPQIERAQIRLDAFNASAGRGTQNLAAFRNGSRSTGRQLDRDGNSIDKFSGRMGLAVDGVLTLGSALIPIGALAGQAAGGLAALGVSAVIGAGSAILAFQGVLDAVKKVQEYQDDPTADNLAEAREELDNLAPAARQFVIEFQKSRPIFADIKNAAAAGWFPGLTQALGDLDVLAPKLENILLKSGQMGGALVADGVESLGGERWAEFFDFIDDEVPSAMASLSRIMGDLGHGAAKMWMELDPGNDSFIAWLEDVASGFDAWASSAEGAEDIEAFLAYARQNGPAVGDFFASIGGALVSIVEAAAPLGGPTLQILTAVSDVIGTIADSDMGSPILAGLAALRLFSRAQATLQSTMVQNLMSPWRSTTPGGVPPAVNAALPPHLRGAAAAPHPSVVAAQRRAARLTQGAQGAALAGMVALSTTGLGDLTAEAGLSNTAMLTLMGTMVAPGWGTAAGAVAGVAMDVAASNDDLAESFDKVQAAIDSGDFSAMTTELDAARKKLDEFTADNQAKGFWDGALDFDLGKSKNTIEGWLGKSDVEEGEQALAALESQQYRNQVAAYDLATALGMAVGPLDGSARSTAELQAALEAARPAMDALGISQEELVAGSSFQDWADGGTDVAPVLQLIGDAAVDAGLGADDLNSAIDGFIDNADSAEARLSNYQAVLRSLAEDEGTAADQADRFRESLDALLDPTLDAEEALSKQREALKAISELDTSGGFSVKTETGRTAAETTRDYVKAVEERAATMINAQRSEEDVAAAVAKSREQFIASGVAAGFSAKQMRRRADVIGLTPKLVETTFEALGISKFDRAVRGIRDLMADVPKRVLTDIATNGIPKSKAEVDALVEKYKLTEKQRTALITLIDRASGQIAAANSALARFDGNRADSYIYTHHVQVNETRNAGRIAEGSYDVGGYTGLGSKHDIAGVVHRNEVVLPSEVVLRDSQFLRQRYGYLPGMADLPGYAAGGLVNGRRNGGTDSEPVDFDAIHTFALELGNIDFGSIHEFAIEVDDAAGGLKGLKKQLHEAEKALQRETARRDAARSLRDEVGGSLSAGELFGNGLAGFDTALAANTNDTQAGNAALAQAQANGLDGPLYQLLAGSGDLTTLQQFAGLTPAQIRRRERQYAELTASQSRLGNAAVFEKYGESINHMTRDIRQMTREVRRLDKAVEKGAERGTRRGSRAGTEAGAHAGTASGQRVRDRNLGARVRAGR